MTIAGRLSRAGHAVRTFVTSRAPHDPDRRAMAEHLASPNVNETDLIMPSGRACGARAAVSDLQLPR